MAKYEAKEKVDFNTTFGFVASPLKENEISSKDFHKNNQDQDEVQFDKLISSKIDEKVQKTPKPLSSYITI